MLDRTDRSLVGIWWWTVDKWLLASALLLMTLGMILVMAASPAVASLINLSSQHFIVRQIIYLVPALMIMLSVSMLEPRPIRALSLVGLVVVIGLMFLAVVKGNEIKGAIESFLLELVGQRGLYDFLVVCDDTNNTPTRIDRNELYVDIAIEPVKSVEFIYIPLRIKNTGEIAKLGN